MKTVLLMLLAGFTSVTGYGQIIADHNAVAAFDNIPKTYLNEVKKMLVWFPGESHSAAYAEGLDLLETINNTYQSIVQFGWPEYYAGIPRLRMARWPMDGVGEDRWFTWKAYASNVPEASTVIKGLIKQQADASNPIHLTGFAWCWDMVYGNPTAAADPILGVHWYGETVGGPDGNKAWGIDANDYAQTGNRVSIATYLAATEDYITYCTTNSPLTNVAFTTGPVDHYAATGEGGYQTYLKHEAIRNYVEANGKILFDYADILCYDNGASSPNTATWNGHTYPIITSTNGASEDVGHITYAGALRLAKAQWWLLARIAGWKGNVATRSEEVAEVVDPAVVSVVGEELRIEMKDPANLPERISIHNLQGNTVSHKDNPGSICSFSTTGLPSGIYLVVISVAWINKTQKIFIQ